MTQRSSVFIRPTDNRHGQGQRNLFVYLTGVLRSTPEYITYTTTAANIMVMGKLGSARVKPTTILKLLADLPPLTVGEEGSMGHRFGEILQGHCTAYQLLTS